MATVFWICAVVGGTILVVQFVLALIGFGADAFDLDVGADAVDGDLDTSGDFDTGDLDAGGELPTDADAAHHHLDSTWLFRAISLRTIIAAVAFFGIAGLIGQQAGYSTGTTVLMAVGAGAGALYGVYYMMLSLSRLTASGNVRIGHAVGSDATVYTPIPAEHSGRGKVQLNLQGRTMAYLAETTGPELPTGTGVVVTAVLAPDTLEVERP